MGSSDELGLALGKRMLYAQHNGEQIEATPNLRRARCRICEQEVIAKCGEIIVWHWAHRTTDCDPWSESETAWHKNWKELFPMEWREVRMGAHRCDVRTPTHVVELQHSSIGPPEIAEREAFYGQMVWVFDLRSIAHSLDVPPQQQGAFRWPHFRKSIGTCKQPVFGHLRRGMLLNIYDYGEPRYYCRYRRFTKDEFMASIGCPNTRSPVQLETFASRAKHDIKTARERWWQEHDLRTQPWLKRE
jgi:hypothetical protein